VDESHPAILRTGAGIGIFSYGIFISASGSICGGLTRSAGGVMDVWFIGLIVVLALSTWGAIALFARLLK
jgi:hypothetical protein